MEDFTRSNQKLNAWFITGCWATVTPKEAFLNALNRRTDMVIIGFDTVKEELLLVKEGVVQALIGQRPYQMGEQCITKLYDIVVHNKMPKKEIYDTGVDIVTKENVDQFLN
jgi:ribose transport system substrate-binding protein